MFHGETSVSALVLLSLYPRLLCGAAGLLFARTGFGVSAGRRRTFAHAAALCSGDCEKSPVFRLIKQGGNGRRERIRTSGPHVPNVVLYQAELLSGPLGRRSYRGGTGGPQPVRALKGLMRLSMVRAPARVAPGLLGRSQAVRHRILIPACEGSNPSAPATPLRAVALRGAGPADK
jgi:hypothetical protein